MILVLNVLINGNINVIILVKKTKKLIDFIVASKKVKLTSRQKEVLYIMINNENTREYTRDIECICEKFKKSLKK